MTTNHSLHLDREISSASINKDLVYYCSIFIDPRK